MFQAHREAIQLPRDARRPGWRHAQMALFVAALWLLVAVAATATRGGALGMFFTGTAVLWIWIAAVETEETRSPPAA